MDWAPVEKAAKDDAGNYQVLVDGSWRPASKVAKNDAGAYMAMMDAPASAAFVKAGRPSNPDPIFLKIPGVTPEMAATVPKADHDLTPAPSPSNLEAINDLFFRRDIKIPETPTGKKIAEQLSDFSRTEVGSNLLKLLEGAMPGMTGLSREAVPAAHLAGKAANTVAQRVPVLPSFSLPGAGIVGKATGSAAKSAAEELRAKATGLAGSNVDATRAAAAPIQRELSAVERAQQQLAQQPAVAAARAEEKAMDPAKVAAEKIAVRTKAAARARAAEEEHRKAGMTTEQAKAAAQEAEGKHVDAQAAADALEQELLSKPGTTKEVFGEMLRTATEKLRTRYEEIRGEKAQFGSVIDAAGEAKAVNTEGMSKVIEKNLRGIKNPNLQATLDRIQSLIGGDAPRSQTGMQAEMNALVAPVAEKTTEVLTLRQADSLKKYLDSIIQTRQIKDMAGNAMAVDKETMAVVREVKASLMQGMTNEANPITASYKTALEKYRKHSRPLDIVERKGSLRPVLDADPVSSEYALTEAQVVGKVIEKAKSGSPTLTTLMQESPAIKDSARLYFTQELFGAGAAPTESGLRTWLKLNERPLKQLGLYDEFKDMQSAKNAAQQAVQDAKGAVSSAGKDVSAARTAEAEAARKASSAVGVSKLSQSRLEKALGSADTPEQIAAQSAKRAGQAEKGLAQKESSLRSSLESKRKVADRFDTFRTEVENAKPAELPGKIKSMGKRLLDDKLITQDEYGEIIRHANEVDKTFEDKAHARKTLAWAAGLLGVGVAGKTGVSHFFP